MFAAATAHLDNGTPVVSVSLLDSRGLRALVATRGRLNRSDRSLALVLSNPSVMRIFQITHFDEWFEIYPSLGAAGHRNLNGNGHG